MNSLEPDFLRGSYPPVITPFKENGDVDYDSYENLVDWQICEGSHGIVVNGTSAEPAVLTTEERKTLLEIGMRVAKGRVPVMAATGSQSFAESAVLTDHATKHGAPARQLSKFENSPILIVESEASFYAPYNRCTAKYLEQAGVAATYVKTQDEGFPGGGHMFMIELDSDDVAQIVQDWLTESVDGTH